MPPATIGPSFCITKGLYDRLVGATAKEGEGHESREGEEEEVPLTEAPSCDYEPYDWQWGISEDLRSL